MNTVTLPLGRHVDLSGGMPLCPSFTYILIDWACMVGPGIFSSEELSIL